MKLVLRDSIYLFLERRAAFRFSFSNSFYLYLVFLVIPFFDFISAGFTSSSLSGSYSNGIVVSMRKWQAMSLDRLAGAKQASAIMLTVRLSVQTFLL